METQQVLALAGLIISVAVLFWIAYRQGLSDGRAQTRLFENAANATAIEELKQTVKRARFLNFRMRAHCASVDARSRMGDPERKILMHAAAKLTLAAETFRTLPARRTDVDETIHLRNQTLMIASMLAPIELGEAA
jgi:hypothetical protein